MIQHFLLLFIWTSFFPIILLFGPELFTQFGATHQIANLHSATCVVTFPADDWEFLPPKTVDIYIWIYFFHIASLQVVCLPNDLLLYVSLSKPRNPSTGHEHPHGQPIRWPWIEHPGARRQVAWDIELIFYHLAGRLGVGWDRWDFGSPMDSSN